MEQFYRPLCMARSMLRKKLILSVNINKSNEMCKFSSNIRRPHTTVDPSDIKKHSESVNIWWDPNGKIKGLHSFNVIRVPFIRDGLVHCSPDERNTTPLSGKNILDVGCGGGILSEALARLGARVTGVDAGKELIEVAQEHSKIDPKLENNRPTYMCTTIEEHAESHKNYYDAVVASEVIEHVNEKELFIKCCVDVLKPGGRIFITAPTRTRLSQFLGIFVVERILSIVPRGTHEYEKFPTPTEITFLLERNNCHVEISYGITYNPFANRWKFITSQQLMFALQAVKS